MYVGIVVVVDVVFGRHRAVVSGFRFDEPPPKSERTVCPQPSTHIDAPLNNTHTHAQTKNTHTSATPFFIATTHRHTHTHIPVHTNPQNEVYTHTHAYRKHRARSRGHETAEPRVWRTQTPEHIVPDCCLCVFVVFVWQLADLRKTAETRSVREAHSHSVWVHQRSRRSGAISSTRLQIIAECVCVRACVCACETFPRGARDGHTRRKCDVR